MSMVEGWGVEGVGERWTLQGLGCRTGCCLGVHLCSDIALATFLPFHCPPNTPIQGF